MTCDRRSHWRDVAAQCTALRVLAAVLFAFAGFVVFRFPANHDLSWLQHAAGRWLDGAEPYVDFIEVNPPLILELHVLAELLARVTGIWSVTVFRLLVLAAAACSLSACHLLLRRLLGRNPLVPFLFTVLLVWLFVGLPRYEFGQRDHLAVVATLPWILLAADANAMLGVSRRARSAAGIVAALGFALKPHFLLAWLLIEGTVALRAGFSTLRRAEHVALIATGAMYAARIPLLTPGYLFVARLIIDAYGAYATTTPWALLERPDARLAFVSVTVAFVTILLLKRLGRARDPINWLLITLGAAVIGFTAAVLLQRRGWTYHWIPVQVSAWLLLGVAAATLSTVKVLAPRPLAHARLVGSAVVVIGVCWLYWLAFRGIDDVRAHRARMRGRSYQLAATTALVERVGQQPTFAALSTNLGAAFPLISYTDAKWVLRFNALWPLVGAYATRTRGATDFPYHTPAAMQRAERFMFDATIDDLITYRPTLLLVDTTPPGYVLHGFDYFRYFGQDARFAAFIGEYHELPRIGRYRVFRRG